MIFQGCGSEDVIFGPSFFFSVERIYLQEMFTTLRLKDSMEDVGKGPLKKGDALYQHTACVHCKRRKVSLLVLVPL